MKKEIHPNYFDAKISCACGNVIEVGSTVKQLTTEVCAKCHPFYTGKQKHLDTTGRVEKFNKKYQKFLSGQGQKTEEVKEEKKETVKEEKKEVKKETKKKAESK